MELFVSLPYDLCRTYKCSQIFSFVHIACKSTIFAKRNQMCIVPCTLTEDYYYQNKSTAMSATVKLNDKTFQLSIPHEQLIKAISRVGGQISHDYADKECPLFLGVLNGAFMFMGELMQHIDLNCEVSFIKMASYSGTASTGKVQELIGLSKSIEGRHVIIVEDIVDTGGSIDHLFKLLTAHKPASIAVATLLFKPDSYRKTYKIDYPALEIPDKFIVGFGLDYNQLGRNLKDIYELATE